MAEMAEFVKVAVDAMGGDNAPTEIIKGAVQAVEADERIRVCLVGKEEVIERELASCTYPKDRVDIVNATEVIETAEPPVNAIRKKKDSSIVRGLELVKCSKCGALMMPHRVCKACGSYNKREIVKVEA